VFPALPTPGPLFWLVGATFLHFVSLFCLYATLPLYVLDLGGSTAQVGLVMGAFSVASLAARPFFGAWIDRSGHRPFLLGGAAIYVVASLGYLGMRSVPALFLWRAFHAMGLATFSTASAALAGDLAPSRRRGTTMGQYGLAQAAALSVGPGMGVAVQRALGYPGLFLGTACAATGALLCALAVPETRVAAGVPPSPGPASRGLGSLRLGGAPALAQFAASIAHGTILSFTAVVAQRRGLDVVGTYFALLALSSLGIRLVAGRAYDAWGLFPVLAPAFLVLAAGMGLLAVAGGATIFLLAGVLAGAGIGATHTTLLARVFERSPIEGRGTAVGVFTSFWQLGVGGGSMAMGRLAEAAGFSGMFAAVAAMPLIGLVGLLVFRGAGIERS